MIIVPNFIEQFIEQFIERGGSKVIVPTTYNFRMKGSAYARYM